jgi:hypothetical protein
MFFKSKKAAPPPTVVRLKLCPLINGPCLRTGCMMYRRTVTGAGYCGLAAKDMEECFKLEYEEEEAEA